jgi:hypothetical protein
MGEPGDELLYTMESKIEERDRNVQRDAFAAQQDQNRWRSDMLLYIDEMIELQKLTVRALVALGKELKAQREASDAGTPPPRNVELAQS